MKDELPEIRTEVVDQPFDSHAVSQLESILPSFIVERRWYRSKARTISRLAVQDVLPMPEADATVLVLRIEYADGGGDLYILPVSLTARKEMDQLPAKPDELIAKFSASDGTERILYGAFSNPKFRNGLIAAIACDKRVEGRRGELVAAHTSALDRECGATVPELDSFVSRAEQSNTSIIYADRFILKLFRKLEPGINPDVEIGRFLTERRFAHTPAVLGTIEYREKEGGQVYAAAILQAFVRNQGDAWKYTLESLADFFTRTVGAGLTKAPEIETHHPLELLHEEVPAQARNLIGSYLDAARLLGTRTAQMHAALADQQGGPDFVPEPFAPADGQKLYNDMIGQADIAFELLHRKQSMLAGTGAENAQALLQMEPRVRERFSPLRDYPISTVRIRHHGDYHLGQVLYTGDDFMIIDFEGEPARPLSERRLKTLAMRDVAGMIRSFQYAAYAALFGQVTGVRVDAESVPAIESWAAFWTTWVSAEYMKAYLQTACGLSFLPQKPEEQRILFDAFLLQKALYEVAYELNNRPDWVRIPLRGILSLIS